MRRGGQIVTKPECVFAAEYQAKYPKAVESLTANWERLVSFFDFPAEHWKHLRTTNVIESAFATVRLRERVTKGAGSRTKGLLMAFKLLDMAQQRWRRLDGAALLSVTSGLLGERGGEQTLQALACARQPRHHGSDRNGASHAWEQIEQALAEMLGCETTFLQGSQS